MSRPERASRFGAVVVAVALGAEVEQPFASVGAGADHELLAQPRARYGAVADEGGFSRHAPSVTPSARPRRGSRPAEGSGSGPAWPLVRIGVVRRGHRPSPRERLPLTLTRAVRGAEAASGPTLACDRGEARSAPYSSASTLPRSARFVGRNARERGVRLGVDRRIALEAHGPPLEPPGRGQRRAAADRRRRDRRRPRGGARVRRGSRVDAGRPRSA